MNAMVRRVLAGVVLLGLLGPVTRGYAQRFGASPISVRIEGFVGPTTPGVVPQATWVVRVREREYTLQVTRLEVLTGNVAYFDIIQALTPYSYAFTVYGDDQSLATLTQAAPDQKLAIIGHAQLAELPGLLFIGSIQTVALTPLPSPPVGS